MTNFEGLRQKIKAMGERVQQHAPAIIAETATEFYKDRFKTKEWEGVPWCEAKNPPSRGSLMVRSGALVSTIRPALVTRSEVRIRAGSPRVPYAQIHNEGGVITQIPTPKQRRFLWAQAHKAGEVAAGKGFGKWGRSAISKELKIPIPRRQFIGKSGRLNKQIAARLAALAKL